MVSRLCTNKGDARIRRVYISQETSWVIDPDLQLVARVMLAHASGVIDNMMVPGETQQDDQAVELLVVDMNHCAAYVALATKRRPQSEKAHPY